MNLIKEYWCQKVSSGFCWHKKEGLAEVWTMHSFVLHAAGCIKSVGTGCLPGECWNVVKASWRLKIVVLMPLPEKWWRNEVTHLETWTDEVNDCCYNFTYSEPWPHLFYSLLRPDHSRLILYDTLTALSVSLTVEFPLLNYFSHDYSALLQTYSFLLTLLTDRLGLCARPISI